MLGEEHWVRVSIVNSAIDGKTPLHVACMKGHIDVVKALIENGADVNIKDGDIKTGLDIAREKNHLEITELLELSVENLLTTISPFIKSWISIENIACRGEDDAAQSFLEPLDNDPCENNKLCEDPCKLYTKSNGENPCVTKTRIKYFEDGQSITGDTGLEFTILKTVRAKLI